MTKTMVQVINEHAKHGQLEDGRYGCQAKDCNQIYGVTYPESIVVTAHVVNRLAAAGFGSRRDAWTAGYRAGATDMDFETPNPHPETA